MIYCAQITFKTWEISMLVLIFNSNKSLVVVYNYIFHILQSLTLKYFTNVKKLMYVKKNVKTSKITSNNWRRSNIWRFLNEYERIHPSSLLWTHFLFPVALKIKVKTHPHFLMANILLLQMYVLCPAFLTYSLSLVATMVLHL